MVYDAPIVLRNAPTIFLRINRLASTNVSQNILNLNEVQIYNHDGKLLPLSMDSQWEYSENNGKTAHELWDGNVDKYGYHSSYGNTPANSQDVWLKLRVHEVVSTGQIKEIKIWNRKGQEKRFQGAQVELIQDSVVVQTFDITKSMVYDAPIVLEGPQQKLLLVGKSIQEDIAELRSSNLDLTEKIVFDDNAYFVANIKHALKGKQFLSIGILSKSLDGLNDISKTKLRSLLAQLKKHTSNVDFFISRFAELFTIQDILSEHPKLNIHAPTTNDYTDLNFSSANNKQLTPSEMQSYMKQPISFQNNPTLTTHKNDDKYTSLQFYQKPVFIRTGVHDSTISSKIHAFSSSSSTLNITTDVIFSVTQESSSISSDDIGITFVFLDQDHKAKKYCRVKYSEFNTTKTLVNELDPSLKIKYVLVQFWSKLPKSILWLINSIQINSTTLNHSNLLIDKDHSNAPIASIKLVDRRVFAMELANRSMKSIDINTLNHETNGHELIRTGFIPILDWKVDLNNVYIDMSCDPSHSTNNKIVLYLKDSNGLEYDFQFPSNKLNKETKFSFQVNQSSTTIVSYALGFIFPMTVHYINLHSTQDGNILSFNHESADAIESSKRCILSSKTQIDKRSIHYTRINTLRSIYQSKSYINIQLDETISKAIGFDFKTFNPKYGMIANSNSLLPVPNTTHLIPVFSENLMFLNGFQIMLWCTKQSDTITIKTNYITLISDNLAKTLVTDKILNTKISLDYALISTFKDDSSIQNFTAGVDTYEHTLLNLLKNLINPTSDYISNPMLELNFVLYEAMEGIQSSIEQDSSLDIDLNDKVYKFHETVWNFIVEHTTVHANGVYGIVNVEARNKYVNEDIGEDSMDVGVDFLLNIFTSTGALDKLDDWLDVEVDKTMEKTNKGVGEFIEQKNKGGRILKKLKEKVSSKNLNSFYDVVQASKAVELEASKAVELEAQNGSSRNLIHRKAESIDVAQLKKDQEVRKYKYLSKNGKVYRGVKLTYGFFMSELIGVIGSLVVNGFLAVTTDQYDTNEDKINAIFDKSMGGSSFHVINDAARGLSENKSEKMMNGILGELFGFHNYKGINTAYKFTLYDKLVGSDDNEIMKIQTNGEIDDDKFSMFFEYIYMKYIHKHFGVLDRDNLNINFENYQDGSAGTNADYSAIRGDIYHLLNDHGDIIKDFVSQLIALKSLCLDLTKKTDAVNGFSLEVAIEGILKCKMLNLHSLMCFMEESRQTMNKISLSLIASEGFLATASITPGSLASYAATIGPIVAAIISGLVEVHRTDAVIGEFETINNWIEQCGMTIIKRMQSAVSGTFYNKKNSEQKVLDAFNKCLINKLSLDDLKANNSIKNNLNNFDYTNLPQHVYELVYEHQSLVHDNNSKSIRETAKLCYGSWGNILYGANKIGQIIVGDIIHLSDCTNKFYYNKFQDSNDYSIPEYSKEFNRNLKLTEEEGSKYIYNSFHYIHSIESPDPLFVEKDLHKLISTTNDQINTQSNHLYRYLKNALDLSPNDIAYHLSMLPDNLRDINSYYRNTYSSKYDNRAFIPFVLGQCIKATEKNLNTTITHYDIQSLTDGANTIFKIHAALQTLQNIVNQFSFIQSSKNKSSVYNINYMALKIYNASVLSHQRAFPNFESECKKIYDAYQTIADTLDSLKKKNISNISEREMLSSITELMYPYYIMKAEEKYYLDNRKYSQNKQDVNDYISNATATQNDQDSDFMFFTKHMYNTCPLEYNDSKSDLYTNHSVIDFMKKTMQGGVVFSNGLVTYTKFDTSYSLVEITIQKNTTTQSKEYKTTAIMYSNREDMKKNINYFLGVSVNGSKRAVNGFGLRLFQRIPIGEGKTEIKLPSVTITIDRSKNIDSFWILFNDYIKLIMESDTSKHADIFNVSKHSTSSMLNYHPTKPYGETKSMYNKYLFYKNKLIGRDLYEIDNILYYRNKQGGNYWYAPIIVNRNYLNLELDKILDLDASGNNKNILTGYGKHIPTNTSNDLVKLSTNHHFMSGGNLSTNYSAITLISKLLDNPISTIQGQTHYEMNGSADNNTKNDVIIKFIKHGNDTKLKVGTLSVVTKDGGEAIHVLTESLESLSYRFPGFTKAHLQGCTIKYSDMSYNNMNMNKFGNQYIKEYEMVVTDANDSFEAKQDVETSVANITNMYESNATHREAINDNYSKVTVTRLGNILGSFTSTTHNVWKKESIISSNNILGMRMRAYYTYNGATRTIDYTKYPVGAIQTITVDGKKRVQDKTTYNDGTTSLGPEYDSPVDKRTITGDLKHIVVTYKNGHKEFVTIYGRYAKSSSPTEKNMTAYDNAVVALATHSVDYERTKVDSKSNPSIGYTEYDDGTSTTDAGIAAANVANAANDAVNDVANAFGNAFGNTFGF